MKHETIMTDTIKDAETNHWVYKAPKNIQPFLQLARYDRPVGYWLLALPGWIGLAFASLSHGFAGSDMKWAALILIGAIAMRGAGCTYNDIVDRDLDAKVDRTALRPIPAETITLKQAWIWLGLQCAIGLIVLLFMPRLAQIISLCSIPLVAAYPFMKRITWWPQVWLGLTFNWAVLVAYAAKTGTISPAVCVLYAGLIFWTIGYDTIYACQDIEDDMKIGVKSTARRFGEKLKIGIGVCYIILVLCFQYAVPEEIHQAMADSDSYQSLSWSFKHLVWKEVYSLGHAFVILIILGSPLAWQVSSLETDNSKSALKLFKFNVWIMLIFVLFLLWLSQAVPERYQH